MSAVVVPGYKLLPPTVTSGQKWFLAFIIGILFLIFSSPWVARAANSITVRTGPAGTVTVPVEQSVNTGGWLLTSLVFFLVVRLVLGFL